MGRKATCNADQLPSLHRKLQGRAVSEVEAWVHTHRGPNPEDMTSLNTEEATKCLETYKATVIELNEPEFDWLHSPLDVRALYQCSCGRQHGKWATFNGTVNDSEVLPQLKGSHASAMAARRQRQQEEEQLRKEALDSRLAKEYAQTMMEWGRMVQDRDEKIQKFMESMAMHCGMPLETVPSPLPPPPPTYVVSPSPNPSPDNAGTFGSAIRGESPEELLSRIAYGRFGAYVNNTSGCNYDADILNTNATGGGFVNGTASGGGNYSPPQVDEFPLF